MLCHGDDASEEMCCETMIVPFVELDALVTLSLNRGKLLSKTGDFSIGQSRSESYLQKFAGHDLNQYLTLTWD
jgi:hypothetical protein